MPMVYKEGGRLRHPRFAAYLGDNNNAANAAKQDLIGKAKAKGVSGTDAARIVDSFMTAVCQEKRAGRNVDQFRMAQIATDVISQVDIGSVNPVALISLAGDLAAAFGSWRAEDICSYNAGPTSPPPGSGGSGSSMDTSTVLIGIAAILGGAILVRKFL